jgi:sulfur-carrier protein
MTTHIQIKLYATLKKLTPDTADHYPIEPGATVKDIIADLEVPLEQAKLIFIDGVRKGIDTVLNGGERVGVFPPVGGG